MQKHTTVTANKRKLGAILSFKKDVEMKKSDIKWALLPAAAAVLIACGGGGGGGEKNSGSDPSDSSSFVLNGVGATGIPIANGAVTVMDSSGNSVATSTTDEMGVFSVSVPLTAQGPFFLRIIKDDIDLSSIYTGKEAGSVNVNPLTDAVVAMVNPSGDNTRLAEELQAGKAISAAQVQVKVELLLAALKPMIDAIEAQSGSSIGNFMNGEITAGSGQGLDKLLDSVGINKSVVSASDGKAVVTNELNFKTALADNEVAKVISVASTDSLSSVQTAAAAVAIDENKLISDEAPALYLNLLKSINECYAQPVLTRTDGANVVRSPECKAIFFNQDYTQFLNGGSRVGKGKAFNGMFSYEKTVLFSPSRDTYLRQDLNGSGNAIVATTWINEDGNKENIYHYVKKYQRKDSAGNLLTANGKPVYALGITGDQNVHPFSIESHNQHHQYVLLKTSTGARDSSWDYVQSGYLVIIKSFNVDGQRILGAEVLTPSGRKIRMAPSASGSRADLEICKKDQNFDLLTKTSNCNGSKLITMAEAFIDPAQTRKPSSYADLGLVRPLDADGKPFTPSSKEVEEQKIMGQWETTLYLEDGSTRMLKARHVARPMTAEELMGAEGPGAKMAQYTDQAIADIKALRAAAVGDMKDFGINKTVSPIDLDPAQPIPAPASGGFKFAWAKEAGQYSPTWLWASGRTQVFNPQERTVIGADTRPIWDDIVNIPSTATRGEVSCSRASSIDIHCAPVTYDRERVNNLLTGRIINIVQSPSSPLTYNPYVWMSYSELGVKDPAMRNIMRAYRWHDKPAN
jgi:hypothetical protein